MRLRYSFLLTLAALLLVPSAAAQNDLVLTGVFDGSLSGGTPKGVEIYVAGDVADLSRYGIGSANNGGGTDGVEFALSGSASAGDYLYVTNNSDSFTTFFGSVADFESGAVSINGDDAIELFYDAAGFPADLDTYTGTPTVTDTFGDIDVDGSGQPWDYLDGWAYREAMTGPDGSTFVLASWTFSGVDGLEGGTDNASATTPFPVGSYAMAGPVDAVTLTALLRGENEVPAVETDGASGGATAVLDGGTLTVTGTFTPASKDDYLLRPPPRRRGRRERPASW